MVTKSTASLKSDLFPTFTFNGAKYNPNVPESIELSRIYWNKPWNVRGARTASSTDSDGSALGWSGLVCSLATEAQRDPVCIRPNPNFVKGSKKEEQREFTGVYGFQRADARMLLAAQSEETTAILTQCFQLDEGATASPEEIKAIVARNVDPNPTIRAFVRELNDRDARRLNIEENTQRNPLPPQDTVYAIHHLLTDEPTLSSVKLGVIMNMSQVQAAMLSNIARKLGEAVIPAGKFHKNVAPVTVLDAWRGMTKRMGQKAVNEIAKLESPAERTKAFLATITPAEASGEGSEGGEGGESETAGGKGGKGKAILNACTEDAPRVAAMLVALQTLGVIQITGKVEGSAAVLACMAAAKRTISEGAATNENIGKIADAINASVASAQKAAAKVANGKGQKTAQAS